MTCLTLEANTPQRHEAISREDPCAALPSSRYFGVDWRRAGARCGNLADVRRELYTAPDAPAIADGVVVIRDGKIVAAGATKTVCVFPKARDVSECSGGVVTAGFQNSHVHFMEAKSGTTRHTHLRSVFRRGSKPC